MSPNTEQLILKELTEIRTRVHIYLGNGTDGSVPTMLKEIKTTVAEHQSYIDQQKGKSEQSTGRWPMLAVIASYLGLALTLIYQVTR